MGSSVQVKEEKREMWWCCIKVLETLLDSSTQLTPFYFISVIFELFICLVLYLDFEPEDQFSFYAFIMNNKVLLNLKTLMEMKQQREYGRTHINHGM